MEINVVVPQETENLSASRSSRTTLANIPKGCFIEYRKTCSNIFNGDLFIIAKNWKLIISLYIYIIKIWYIYITACYSAVKINEIC